MRLIGRVGGLDDQREGIPGHGFAHQFDLACGQIFIAQEGWF